MLLCKQKYFHVIVLCITTIIVCKAQIVSPSPSFFKADSTINKKRVALVAATESGLYAGSLIGLNELWYKNYPRSSFHFFNDNNEWLQMDKAGHFVTAYNVGKIGIDLLKWSGVNHKKAIWYGGLLGVVYLSNIELLDGFSDQWGFSWGDFSANVLGSVCLISQEYLWQEQRVLFKYSASPSKYAKYRPNVLGSNFSQQLLKDYNGQTYWISTNIGAFIGKETRFPKWLNIALGYGAEGMTGGSMNPTYIDNNGNPVYFERYRQYYLSLDIDLTRIQVKSPFLKTVFKIINFIKVPAPALELSKGKLKGHLIHF